MPLRNYMNSDKIKVQISDDQLDNFNWLISKIREEKKVMKLSEKLQKFLSLMLVFALVIGMVPATNAAATETTTPAVVSPTEGINSGDIVILYDNDVHCAIDGYANIAELKDEMETKTDYVTLVSNGDFIQGDLAGALSKGEWIIDIMNATEYDIVTLGNHEFDFEIPQLFSLMNYLDAKVVSCNFKDLAKDKSVYSPYKIVKYGDKKVAFVGITTPESITKSTPTYFQNEKGEYVYGFCGDTTGEALYSCVQKAVNQARKAGADYVVALAHLGTDGTTAQWTSTAVIENTTGIDVMLDGHSHSTFEADVVKNEAGKDVIVSQTGTKFANIGKLVITKDGKISTQLIPIENYTAQDEEVVALVTEIKAEQEKLTNKVIGKTTVDLTTLNPETGLRAVRSSETNLGDFCADALRTVLDTDIAIMNGGGIRADIPTGKITYANLVSVFPWGNMGCVIEVTGQQLKDALELGAMNFPQESGGFLQVSGIKYKINSKIASSVKVDEEGMFQSVEGKYRVKKIKIYNEETGKYEKLDLDKTYTLAGINYTLKSCGDGFTMFGGSKIVKDDVAVDCEVLITYLEDYLGGVVGEEYAKPQGRIKIK